MLCMQISASTTRENPITRHLSADPTHPLLPYLSTCTLSLYRSFTVSRCWPRRLSPPRDKDFSLLFPGCLFFFPPSLEGFTGNKEREKRITREVRKALIERSRGKQTDPVKSRPSSWQEKRLSSIFSIPLKKADWLTLAYKVFHQDRKVSSRDLFGKTL